MPPFFSDERVAQTVVGKLAGEGITIVPADVTSMYQKYLSTLWDYTSSARKDYGPHKTAFSLTGEVTKVPLTVEEIRERAERKGSCDQYKLKPTATDLLFESILGQQRKKPDTYKLDTRSWDHCA